MFVHPVYHLQSAGSSPDDEMDPVTAVRTIPTCVS